MAVAQEVILNIVCNLCNSDEHIQWKCHDCNKWLCGNCKTIHLKSKASKHHKVIELLLTETKQFKKRDETMCVKHPSKSKSVYCKDCRCMLCLSCVSAEHKTHNWTDIQDIVAETKGELQNIIQQVNTLRIPRCNEALQSIQVVKDDISSECGECKRGVLAQGEKIKKVVDNLVTDVVNDISIKEQRYRDEMELQERGINQEISQLRDIINLGEAKVNSLAPHQLIQHVDNMKTKLLSCREQLPREKQYSLKLVFGTIETRVVSEMTGRLISSFGPEVFKKIEYEKPARYVAVKTKDSAFIAQTENTAQLVSSSGTVLESCKFRFSGIRNLAINKPGDLLIATPRSGIKRRDNQGLIHDFFCPDYQCCIFGMSVTSNNDVLVGTYNGTKILRLSSDGKLMQKIESNQNGTRIFVQPFFLAETEDKNIWISDDIKEVVVLDSSGKFKFKYTGGSATSGFKPRGILASNYGSVLICDWHRHSIHQVDTQGNLLRLLLNDEKGFQQPESLSQDEERNIWITACGPYKIYILKLN